MKNFILFYGLLLWISNQASAQLKCVDLFMARKVSSEYYLQNVLYKNENIKGVVELWKLLDGLEQDLITGKKTPTWDDFNRLEWIGTSLKAVVDILSQSDLEFSKELQKLTSEFDEQVNKIKAARASQETIFPDQNIKYGPTDYALRVAYLEKLQQLNQFLPNKLKFIKYKLPKDLNKTKINSDAVKLVNNLEKKHDFFIQNEGFSSHKDLIKQLRLSSKDIQKANELLEADAFEFAMLRPFRGRFWIKNAGLFNQYISKSSEGVYDEQTRNAVEASYINQKSEIYSKKDNDFKPKYGFLHPKLGSPIVANVETQYGEDVYFFKKELLKKRVTFTLGDSLNYLDQSGKWDDSGTRISDATRWDHLFTPWSRKELIAPFIADALKAKYLKLDTKSKAFIGENDSQKLSRAHGGNEYIELQFWGSLTLDHVKAFAFMTKPPSGDFLKTLLEKNIKIYDYTDKKTYKPWSP
jgi:hypothetical protein